MNAQLVTGALVEFTSQPGTYGVIDELNGAVATVRWDPGIDLSPMVNWKSGSLRRVELPSMVVRIGADEPGLLLEPIGDEPPKWRVQFLSGLRTVPEAALRPNQNLDPVAKFRNGQIGSYKKFRLGLVTRHHRLAHLHDDLVSLGHTRVDVKPHQVGVVHRVVTSYPHRFLLCDEVGLGKTIEAGMILKELRTRGIVKRCLIVVPPNLRRQWQFELKTKFNEVFSILDTDTVRYLEKTEGFTDNPFTRYDSVLVSDAWITSSTRSEQVRLVDWDLIIVDEAHHVRSTRHGNGVSTTRLYRLVRELADPAHLGKRSILFLTATPMQLQTHELYSLIELLDPVLFPSEHHFEEHRHAARGLSQLVEQLSETYPIPGEDPATTIERICRWLDLPEHEVRQRLQDSDDGRIALCRDLSDRHLLSEILIRNRKSVVGGFMPRRAYRWGVRLTDEEHLALSLVEDYVQNGFALAESAQENAHAFVMVLFQKLMASSIRALSQSLAGRRDRLLDKAAPVRASAAELEQFFEEHEAADAVAKANLHETEAAELDELVQVLTALPIDSKGEEFVRRMTILFEEDQETKVLVFTEFRETQKYLEELLERASPAGHQIGVNVFHGQLKPRAKDDAVEAFRLGSGAQVLLSTEAGGEGRNFQFCHYLVNYDLPWNPMRVEQRIGRLDRIGQEHVVRVFNLYAEDTVEERVLDVLDRRINAFEETVGGLDPILGEAEDDLRKILRRGPSERDAALDALGRRLEDQVKNARRAEAQLRDFVMDVKSYSREIAEQIAGRDHGLSPAAQQAFIAALLADVRTYIKARGDEFELTFHDPFRGDHLHEFFALSPKRWAVFHPSALRDVEHVEFFAFGHPIIEAIVSDVLEDSYEGATGSWQLESADDLPEGMGWLFVHQVNTSGIQPRSDLVPVFVADNGQVSTEVGSALVSRGALFSRRGEGDIPRDEISVDSIERAAAAAEAHVDRLAEERQTVVTEEADRRVDREWERLQAWFRHRERAAADKLASTRDTLDRLRASTDEGARRILPIWEKNLADAERMVEQLSVDRARRTSELEKYRRPVIDYQLVSVARIAAQASPAAQISR
ncbi:DEAD/DEAH box helicase [Candidatus Poriferisodalis sp.]|uniref:DEAD/DEAH box helicase n=1 Tax=Candidatus Poriferisodalis sp. TaxID=3101277 RepID=UPI003D119D26